MKACQLVVWRVSLKAVSKGNVWVASTAEMTAALWDNRTADSTVSTMVGELVSLTAA